MAKISLNAQLSERRGRSSSNRSNLGPPIRFAPAQSGWNGGGNSEIGRAIPLAGGLGVRPPAKDNVQIQQPSDREDAQRLECREVWRFLESACCAHPARFNRLAARAKSKVELDPGRYCQSSACGVL